jgi:hypothetical protein
VSFGCATKDANAIYKALKPLELAARRKNIVAPRCALLRFGAI